jgi:DnaJ like chaperone protein
MEFLKTRKAALILALVYFVFPLDLIPDIFGPFGRVDDILIFGLAIWRVLKDRNERAQEQRRESKAREQHKSSTDRKTAWKKSDPYALFKLSNNATQAEIDARYKELAKDYHPDRVAHLGEELRKVAHEKMIEIQEAYDALSKGASPR